MSSIRVVSLPTGRVRAASDLQHRVEIRLRRQDSGHSPIPVRPLVRLTGGQLSEADPCDATPCAAISGTVSRTCCPISRDRLRSSPSATACSLWPCPTATVPTSPGVTCRNASGTGKTSVATSTAGPNVVCGAASFWTSLPTRTTNMR